MPFSDPLADGPEIQFSSHYALQKGTNLRQIFELVERIRRKSDMPLVLMGYYNPVYALGPDRFARQAADSGVDGYIIPDLPPEEARELKSSSDPLGLSSIFLVAPTTARHRVSAIDAACTDFVYAVTVTGVTGARKAVASDTGTYLKGLKQRLKHPFVAGFGVSSPDTARRLSRHADGVVIGSALVRLLREAKNAPTGRAAVSRLLANIRKAIQTRHA
jgi:tryptophan synthase alpha chain